MPTYEYACRDCGEHLEVVQSFKDDPLTECPNCDGELRKVFSAAGIIFKGSGWHSKDYGSSSGSPPATATPDSAGQAADTPAGSAESTGSAASGDGGSATSTSPAEKSA